MGKVVVLITLVLLLALSGQASAALMAIWDFGPNADGYTEVVTTEHVMDVPTLLIYDGDKDDNGKDGVAYTDAEGTYHFPGQGGAWNDVRVPGPDAEWLMTINTRGWEDITIRWDYRSEEAPTFDLDYRLNVADDWTKILTNEPITADDTWYSFTLDMPTAVEDRFFVQFRMNDLEHDPDYGNGRYVFDNLEVTGVPEPATILLLGLGGLALLRKRRKINRRER